VDAIVEKPGRENAPSNFASVGGYLLTPDALKYIERGQQQLQDGDEFHLTDYVLEPMRRDGKPFYGYAISNGRRYDTGTKIEYLKTLIDFALRHPDVKDELAAYLKEISKQL
jgi:UTP--glucose-1-phosphate uridylyltransferase